MWRSPAKNRTASVNDATGMTSMSSTTAASVALAAGTTSPLSGRSAWSASRAWRAVAMAIDSAPRAGRVNPSSESSPTTA